MIDDMEVKKEKREEKREERREKRGEKGYWIGIDLDLGSSEAHALARVHDHEHLLDRLQRDRETSF
jgi:hypothetical protein